MNIEILRIHEDYKTTTIFTLMLLNGLLVLVTPNFSKLIEELKVFLNRFCTQMRKKDGTPSVYKSSSMAQFILERDHLSRTSLGKEQ